MLRILAPKVGLCNQSQRIFLLNNALKTPPIQTQCVVSVTLRWHSDHEKRGIHPAEVKPQLTECAPAKIVHKPPTVIPKTTKANLLKHYLMLSKIRLTSLVVATSMAGYAMCPAPFDWTTFTMCMVGTGLVAGAANAVNQFHEVPFDAQMKRTKCRVLVKGELTSNHAVMFALATCTSGLGMLYFGANGLTASLGLANFILYTSIYTPLKRVSILNTWVGSVVGAIPPLMGWAACEGTLGPGAAILAGILYSWQFPHFNALSWNLRPDYAKAGYKMMSVHNPDLCRQTALRHSVAITAMSCCAPLTDATNWLFVPESLPVNLYLVYLAYKFYEDANSRTSRQLFKYSLLHLPLLMVLLLLNKKNLFSSSDTTLIDAKKLKEIVVQKSPEQIELRM